MSTPTTLHRIDVEAAPILQKTRHKETINCYDVDSAKKKAVKHNPKIELYRGTIASIDKSGAAEVGPQTYLPVVGCKSNPEAVGLYLRQEEVIEITSGVGSRAVKAPGKLNLRMIKRANKAGKPIMELAKVRLMEGSIFRISNVHRVTSADAGNGAIDADGTVDYYLVIECVDVPAAAGLFVKEGEFTPVEEPQPTGEETPSQESPSGAGGSGQGNYWYV